MSTCQVSQGCNRKEKESPAGRSWISFLGRTAVIASILYAVVLIILNLHKIQIKLTTITMKTVIKSEHLPNDAAANEESEDKGRVPIRIKVNSEFSEMM